MICSVRIVQLTTSKIFLVMESFKKHTETQTENFQKSAAKIVVLEHNFWLMEVSAASLSTLCRSTSDGLTLAVFAKYQEKYLKNENGLLKVDNNDVSDFSFFFLNNETKQYNI